MSRTSLTGTIDDGKPLAVLAVLARVTTEVEAIEPVEPKQSSRR